MRHAERRGFTLLELMLAITLTAGLLLTGRLLVEQVTDAEHAIVAEGSASEAAGAKERTLRELFRNLEVGTSDSATFGGTEREMRFTSWCDSAAGLRGRCAVSLTIDTALTAVVTGAGKGTYTLTPAPASVMARDVTVGAFLYLGDAQNGGRWFSSWNPGINAPLAIGVVFGIDTTVLRIGDRG